MNNPDNMANFAFVNIHDATNLASLSEANPSCASVLKQGTPSAPPVKKSTPSKRTTLDKHKLYLDTAATHRIMFCK